MKNDLRKKYREIRNNINNKEDKDLIIFQKVINNSFVNKAHTILIYVSKDMEVDTINLIKYFLKIKKVAVPKIVNKVMFFYYINSLEDLKKGYYQILEPITKEVVKDFSNCVCLTPGICFTKDGYRIGYGGGFYDKFFQENKVYSIGLCYQECLIQNFHNSIYDYPVNEVLMDD